MPAARACGKAVLKAACYLLAAALLCAAPGAAGSDASPPVVVSLPGAPASQDLLPIPEAFAGLDLPLSDVTTVVGDAKGLNPRFVNLLKGLTEYASHGHLRLRIGNDTLAWSGPRSPQRDRIPALAQLARQFNVTYLLGVDFKSGDPAATLDAIAALTDAASGLPPHSIEALELGNEADLYPRAAQPEGRWDERRFAQRFARFSERVLPLGVGVFGGKVAAPVWAGLKGPFFDAGNPLQRFLAANAAGSGMVDMHQYYGSNCHGATLAPGDLLQAQATTRAQAAFRPLIAAAHARTPRLPFVLSEWNSASCGGIAGVSDTFESALWTLDGLFEWAAAGLDGVMLTTGNGLPYSPWHFAPDSGMRVAPNYYGLRMFLQATQHSARLLRPELAGTRGDSLKAWATLDDGGVLRLVLVNKDARFSAPIDLALAGYQAPVAYALSASDMRATSGVRYAGQTFDDSADGKPAGKLDAPVLSGPAPGRYRYRFEGVGAVLLEFQPQRR